MKTGIAYAPFTVEQVENLIRRQAADWLHGYTCGNDPSHGNLTPTVCGWVCTACDYTQYWAHKSDLEGQFPSSVLFKVSNKGKDERLRGT